MENASKALIIAGAILLAILLISLGIMIFGQAQDTVNNSGMSQAEMQAFNNKFLKYEGTKKGSEVKALLNEVFASNSDDNNELRKVTVMYKANSSATGTTIAGPGSSGNGTTNKTSDIDDSGIYDVGVQYASSDQPTTWHTTKGCIYKIVVTKK